MRCWLITEDEDEALQELPHTAQLAYLRAIRPFMDRESMTVGKHRKISERSIAETLEVPRVRGRHDGGLPSRKVIRHALESLVWAGLLVRIPAHRQLIFKLPLALQDKSVQMKRGQSGANEGPKNSGPSKPAQQQGLQLDEGPMRGQSNTLDEGPTSVVSSQEELKEPKGSMSPSPLGNACPHKQIIDLYHQILPELDSIRVWNDFRKGLLRTRWREDKERQTLDWWRDYFNYVRDCPLLMGQVDNMDWKADLEWLIRPKNICKVIEGKYERAA